MPANKTDKLSNSPSIAISRYLESTAILTLAIGAVYYVGWTYADAYFTRMGIPHLALDLPTTYYLKNGYLAIASLTIVIYSLYINRLPNQNKREAIATNVLLFITIAVWLFPSRVGSKVYFYLAIGQIGLFFLVAVIASLKGVSVVPALTPNTITKVIFFAYFTFGVITLNAYIIGDRTAGQILEGRTSDAYFIKFTWKETAPAEIGDSELIFIIHNKDRYYVVKKERPASAKPRVFIVLDEQVKSATTYSAD
jgi:hypothetical protein